MNDKKKEPLFHIVKPVSYTHLYVEGLLDGVADTPEKQQKYLRTIYNKANDMDRLINELTFYCKIDTNRIPYTFNKINVKDYFDDCFEDCLLYTSELCRRLAQMGGQ